MSPSVFSTESYRRTKSSGEARFLPPALRRRSTRISVRRTVWCSFCQSSAACSFRSVVSLAPARAECSLAACRKSLRTDSSASLYSTKSLSKRLISASSPASAPPPSAPASCSSRRSCCERRMETRVLSFLMGTRSLSTSISLRSLACLARVSCSTCSSFERKMSDAPSAPTMSSNSPSLASAASPCRKLYVQKRMDGSTSATIVRYRCTWSASETRHNSEQMVEHRLNAPSAGDQRSRSRCMLPAIKASYALASSSVRLSPRDAHSAASFELQSAALARRESKW
mmetsp:Transcript_18196/g.41716  ORF Transcript_18196/g.41716 Transcript_18196/m.41716 type:complete len:285 (-) Transcript_18196:548-1402(-)